jgi:hypothetical protein
MNGRLRSLLWLDWHLPETGALGRPD